MDFKIGFLDSALNISDRSISDQDLIIRPSSNSSAQQPGNRRFKSPQIREILTTTARSKRAKIAVENQHGHHYADDGSVANYNNVYHGYPTTAVAATENGLGSYAAAFQPNFYPSIENPRFLTTAENFLHYRHHLSSYYPDYTAHASPYTGRNELPNAYLLWVSSAPFVIGNKYFSQKGIISKHEVCSKRSALRLVEKK